MSQLCYNLTGSLLHMMLIVDQNAVCGVLLYLYFFPEGTTDTSQCKQELMLISYKDYTSCNLQIVSDGGQYRVRKSI